MPAAQTCTFSMKMSSASGAVSCIAAPTACAIRPQFGSPPCSAALTSGELAIARATRSRPRRRSRRGRPRGRSAWSPRRRARCPARACAAPSPAPRRSATSSSDCGSTTHAAGARGLQDHGVVGGELPVHGDAVERARDAHAEQQVGGLGAQRRVGLDEAEHRRERGRDHPRALGLRGQPHGAGRQRDVDLDLLGELVRGADRLGEVAVPVLAQLGAGLARCRGSPRRRPAARRSRPWRRPRPGPRATPPAIDAAPCMRAASSKPRLPVAALALPELATTTRSASSRVRSLVSTTGAASTPERVKRAARHAVRRRADHQPEVQPAATASDRRRRPRRGSPAGGRPGFSVTCAGHLQPA